MVESDYPAFDTGAINKECDVQKWQFKTQFSEYLKAYGSNAAGRGLERRARVRQISLRSLEKFLSARRAGDAWQVAA